MFYFCIELAREWTKMKSDKMKKKKTMQLLGGAIKATN